MTGFNVSFEPGFCTALNKGMLVCPDDTMTPRNFTTFLTPPMKDIEEKEQNANLLKLAVQDKYDCTDLELLTKMDVTIPMTAQDLRHQLRNLTAVAGHYLGQDSIIYGSLLKIQEHTENHEMSYQFEFKNDSPFCGTLLNKIN